MATKRDGVGVLAGILGLATLTAGCTGPEPSFPAPGEPPCLADPTGLICTVAGTGVRAVGGDDLPARETPIFLATSASFDPDGLLLVDDFNAMRIRRIRADGTFETLAGSGLHAYATEGIDARASSLENPIDAVMAPDGTLYIMELHGARVLTVDPVEHIITTYVGSAEAPGYEGYGGDGGPATEASMSQSVGLALDEHGTLFLADTRNNCVRAVSADGIIETLAGNGAAEMADGHGTAAGFNQPYGLDYADGQLYVADRANHAIRRVDVATLDVVTIAGMGQAGFAGDGGPAIDARLNGPSGVAVGPDGAVFVADTDNHVVRRIDPDDGTISTVLGQGGVADYDGDGVPPEASLLNWPNDVAVSAEGDLYVVDTLNDRVRAVIGFADL